MPYVRQTFCYKGLSRNKVYNLLVPASPVQDPLPKQSVGMPMERTMKILLVDDSATMRKIEKKQIEELGVSDILEASNGEEAFTILTQNPSIDMIVLDWNMPQMNGIDFLKKVRAMPQYKNLPIIMCTSESEKRRVVEAMKEGVTNYIIKPFTKEVLKEKLRL